MSTLQTLKMAALAGVCTLAFGAAAQAQYDTSDIAATSTQSTAAPAAPSLGTVSFGISDVTQNSAYFGRYNGMPEAGPGGFLDWNLHDRDAWDSGSTHYLNFTGDNVNVGNGLFAPEASVNLATGEQGTWSVFAGYDAMTYRASNDFTSILQSNGALAPGYVAALQALGTAGPMYGSITTGTAPSYFGSIGSAKHYPGGLNVQTGSVGSTIGHVLGAGITYPANPAALAPYNSATTPSNYDIYLGSLNEMVTHVGTRRDKVTFGTNYDLGDWTLGAVVSHEHKEGTLEQSMTTAGSNSGFIAFPMPVNYDTDTYTVTAAYDTDVMQAHFSYEFSNFKDNNQGGFAFQGWNFTEVRTGASSPYTYTSYELNGVYSLPPSNEAHTISGEIAYNISPTTRLNATGVYGLQLQNQQFVLPTLNAFALSNFGSYFSSNPSSLDGLVQTWFGNVTLNSRPWPDTAFKLVYSIDARDPSTKTMAIYGDPTDAVTPTAINISGGNPANHCTPTSVTCATPWQRIAVPESWTKQVLTVSGDYHFDDSAKATLGYRFNDDERTHAITHHTQDNTGFAKFDADPLPGMTVALGYSYSDRTASAPDFSLWTQQIMADCISNVNGVYTPGTLGCQQIPMYEAARTQNAVDFRLTDSISSAASASLFGKYTDNQYHDPAAVYNGLTLASVGVNKDYNLQAGADLNYRFGEGLDGHLYYTFLRTYRDMRALNNQGTISLPGVYEYSVGSTYDIHTAGIGANWQATDQLKLVGDYVFTYGSQAFAQSGSWTLGEGSQLIGGAPNLSTKSADNIVRLHAVYDYDAKTSFFFGYEFDSVDMSDWALVGKSLGQVLTGDIPPKYNVSTFTLGATLKF